MPGTKRLILVTADAALHEAITTHLETLPAEGYWLVWLEQIEEARRALLSAEADAALVDTTALDPATRHLLEDLRLQGCETPVIAITTPMPDREPREFLKAHVADYLLREQLDAPLLERSLRYVIERHETEKRLEELAYYDALTGIPNRVLFREQLERAIQRAVRDEGNITLFLVNLDGFKRVNDSFGHDAGDRLVAMVADRICHGVRGSDNVARVGADEFTVIIDDASSTADIVHVARKLMEVIGQPFMIEDTEVIMRCSIGIAVCPEAGRDGTTLLRHADMAMMEAKQHPESAYRFYTDSLNQGVEDAARLEAELRHALINEEFALFYQPRLALDSGAIVGMEGLIRWQHPERGLVPPLDFIPYAEQVGLIVPIGYWVVRQACEDIRRMQEAGLPPMHVSVNLSFEQFRDRNFIRTVSDIIRESGIDPRQLEFELTETALMTNARKADRAMRSLNKLGSKFSLDDFGTGYSSFAHIQRLPIAALKIDRSFVSTVMDNPDDAIIVRAMINLAHSLQLLVVAEGAEDKAQMQFLREHRCDQVQGFYFSPPVTYDEICGMIRDKRGLVM